MTPIVSLVAYGTHAIASTVDTLYTSGPHLLYSLLVGDPTVGIATWMQRVCINLAGLSR